MKQWPELTQRPCSCGGRQTEYADSWYCHRCGHRADKQQSPEERDRAITKADEAVYRRVGRPPWSPAAPGREESQA